MAHAEMGGTKAVWGTARGNQRVTSLNSTHISSLVTQPLVAMTALESAALSGSLFRSRSPSPSRSASTASPTNTDDELASDLSGSFPSKPVAVARNGPQTGPKGVIEDRRSYLRQSRLDTERAVRETKAAQEKMKMVGMTSTEDDERKKWEGLLDHRGMEDQDEQEEGEEVSERYGRPEERETGGVKVNHRGRGALLRRVGFREVGKQGFVAAIERPGWLVILIYESVRLIFFHLTTPTY